MQSKSQMRDPKRNRSRKNQPVNQNRADVDSSFHKRSQFVIYAKFRSRSHDAVIRVRDAAGNVIETHEHAGDSHSGEQKAATMSPTMSDSSPAVASDPQINRAREITSA